MSFCHVKYPCHSEPLRISSLADVSGEKRRIVDFLSQIWPLHLMLFSVSCRLLESPKPRLPLSQVCIVFSICAVALDVCLMHRREILSIRGDAVTYIYMVDVRELSNRVL